MIFIVIYLGANIQTAIKPVIITNIISKLPSFPKESGQGEEKYSINNIKTYRSAKSRGLSIPTGV
jgi:hypothetical protein